MKSLLAGLVLTLTVTSAHAWGAREQGILTGVVGTILVQKIMENNAPAPQPVYTPHPVVIHQPRVEYFNCVVQVYDPHTGIIRNEVRSCSRQVF